MSFCPRQRPRAVIRAVEAHNIVGLPTRAWMDPRRWAHGGRHNSDVRAVSKVLEAGNVPRLPHLREPIKGHFNH